MKTYASPQKSSALPTRSKVNQYNKEKQKSQVTPTTESTPTGKAIVERPWGAIATNVQQTTSATIGDRTTPSLPHSNSVLPIQAKHTMGQPNDKYEQEADRVAAQVVQRINMPAIAQLTQDPLNQSFPAKEATSEQRNFVPIQLQGELGKEKLLQGKFATSVMPTPFQAISTPSENRTGMSNQLKAGLEKLSGHDLSGVRVHYNSDKPAKLNALAYTQGQEIQVGPNQERHLPHEGWHVVQQMQRRVKPSLKSNGIAINDDHALEHEADVMGRKASQMYYSSQEGPFESVRTPMKNSSRSILQRMIDEDNIPVAVNWSTLSLLEAKAYLAKISTGGWTVTPTEMSYLRWVANGRPGGLAPGLPGPAPASATPGGSFLTHRPRYTAGLPSLPNPRGGKISWTQITGAFPLAYADGPSLVKRAFREMRIKRSLTKRMFEVQRLELAGGASPGRRQLFGSPEGTNTPIPNLAIPGPLDVGMGYSQLLDKLQDEESLLRDTTPFQTGVLFFAPATGGDGANIEYNPPGVAGAVTVGILRSGADHVYHPGGGGGAGGRPILTKLPQGDRLVSREYILDSRGVITRRFAYMEKSFWQFMDFLSTGSMEGRFQIFSKAIGEAAPHLFENTKNSVTTGGRRRRRRRPTPFTMEQMAVLHQWKGSGPQQRGLCLASTQAGKVLSNSGGEFASIDGFRVTIDLARVPPDVILLNHYAQDGVRSELGQVNPQKHGTVDDPGRERYNYQGSAVKNRELFLEHLEPAWISQVVWHGSPVIGGFQLGDPTAFLVGGVPATPAEWIASQRQRTGHDHYTRGYSNAIAAIPPRIFMTHLVAPFTDSDIKARIATVAAVIGRRPVPPPRVDPPLPPIQGRAYDRGVQSARHYVLGHFHGKLRRAAVGGGGGGGLTFRTISSAHRDVRDDVRDYSTIATTLLGTPVTMRTAPDIYWIGFGHGRRDVGFSANMNNNFLKAAVGYALNSVPHGRRGTLEAPLSGGGGHIPHYQNSARDITRFS